MGGVRICIVGNSGSGKSTLAQALRDQLGINAYHLDRHLLTGNFEPLPKAERQRVHTELITGNDWIIDGSYRSLLPARIERATLVVFLNLGRAVTIPRLLKRRWRGGQNLAAIPEGANPNLMSWEFLHWTAGYKRRHRAEEIAKWCGAFNVPLLFLTKNTTAGWVEAIRHALPQN